MIKKIAIVVGVLVAAVLAYATTKPDTLHVERSTTIQAPPAAVHPLVNDFHTWRAWSPYEKRDPALGRTFSGAGAGQGAVYEWNGNSEVGQGRMEITESTPSKIAIKLDFIKPFEGHNVAEFRFEPKGGSTNITWVMRGPATYLTKLMCVFIDMDDMIGKDFEAGLANLKSVAESKRQQS
ncbi:MAG TPA: SRPBCC family protein [Vicinamibacterales bacterium]|nr:SRPBCC family protein [Vicinamibacterales bacterium]